MPEAGLGVNSLMRCYEVTPMAELLCTYSMFRPQMNSAFLIGLINLNLNSGGK